MSKPRWNGAPSEDWRDGREDLRPVSGANSDAWRVGRGSPGNRLPMRGGGSFAYPGNFPIGCLTIDRGFMPRLTDYGVDRPPVKLRRGAFDRFAKKQTGRA